MALLHVALRAQPLARGAAAAAASLTARGTPAPAALLPRGLVSRRGGLRNFSDRRLLDALRARAAGAEPTPPMGGAKIRLGAARRFRAIEIDDGAKVTRTWGVREMSSGGRSATRGFTTGPERAPAASTPANEDYVVLEHPSGRRCTLAFDAASGVLTQTTVYPDRPGKGPHVRKDVAANADDAAALFEARIRAKRVQGFTSDRTSPSSSSSPALSLPALPRAWSLTLAKGNRTWRVVLDGALVRTEWSTGAEHKVSKRERLYKEGKGGRSAAEQAAFEALSKARRRMNKDGMALIAEENLPDAEGLLGKPVQTAAAAAAAAAVAAATTDKVPVLMLASKCDVGKLEAKHDEVFVQPKLDGLRCLADLVTGRLFSRGRHEFAPLEHVSRVVAGTAADGVRWLDGELYWHGSAIQGLNSAIRGSESPPECRERVELHVFDAVMDAPFEQRWAATSKWWAAHAQDSMVKLVSTERVKTSEITAKHSEFVNQGYEGTMVRLLGEATTYQEGKRSRYLQKVKDAMREEYPCVDILPQKHAVDEQVAGSFVLLMPNGKTFNAAPQCTLEAKREMWENRDEYKSGAFKAMVQCFAFSSEGTPMHPTVVGFRHGLDDDVDVPGWKSD